MVGGDGRGAVTGADDGAGVVAGVVAALLFFLLAPAVVLAFLAGLAPFGGAAAARFLGAILAVIRMCSCGLTVGGRR